MRRDIKRALVASFIARTGASAGLRIVYPFLPAIARGLGTTPAVIAAVVALRNFGGLATPFIARASERHGRRNIMLLAMIATTIGCALTAATSSLIPAAAGIVVVGASKPAFDLPMQAWFGDRVPYSERGRVFGITELTWSASLLLVVPAGFLIAATDWRAPFVLVGVFSAFGAVAIARGVDPDRPIEHVTRRLHVDRSVVLVVAAVILFILSSEILFIVYGQWLEGLGLTVAGIGTFTIALVVAELGGEALVTWTADAIGLKKMWLGGLIVTIVAYLGFALVGSSLLMAVVVVVVWLVAFEVTIVAAVPFASEVAPGARDRMLSMVLVAVALGRAAGALVSQPIYESGGIGASGVASAACVAVATVLVVLLPDHDAGEGLLPH